MYGEYKPSNKYLFLHGQTGAGERGLKRKFNRKLGIKKVKATDAGPDVLKYILKNWSLIKVGKVH